MVNAMENVKEALSELGMTDEIDHVTDFGQIAAMGVMSTPALVINVKISAQWGKVLSKDDVIKALRKRLGIGMKKVAFICPFMQKSGCRSIGKHFCIDVFEDYSAERNEATNKSGCSSYYERNVWH